MSTFTLFIQAIVAFSALWVYWDATAKRIGKIPGQKSFINMSAGAWAICTLFIWIITLPTYLLKRKQLIENAVSNPVNVSGKSIKLGVFAVICAFSIFSLLQSSLFVTIDTPIGGDNAKFEKAFADLEKRLTAAYPELNAQMAYGTCVMIATKTPNQGTTLREYMQNCWNTQVDEAEVRLKTLQGEQKKYTEAILLRQQVSLDNAVIEFKKGSFIGPNTVTVIRGTIKNKSKYLLSSATFFVQLYLNKQDTVIATKNLYMNFENQGGLKADESKEVSFELNSMSDDRNWQTLEVQGATEHKLATSTLKLHDAGNRQLIPADQSKELAVTTQDLAMRKLNAEIYKKL
jgi:hypothetical protein